MITPCWLKWPAQSNDAPNSKQAQSLTQTDGVHDGGHYRYLSFAKVSGFVGAARAKKGQRWTCFVVQAPALSLCCWTGSERVTQKKRENWVGFRGWKESKSSQVVGSWHFGWRPSFGGGWYIDSHLRSKWSRCTLSRRALKCARGSLNQTKCFGRWRVDDLC